MRKSLFCIIVSFLTFFARSQNSSMGWDCPRDFRRGDWNFIYDFIPVDSMPEIFNLRDISDLDMVMKEFKDMQVSASSDPKMIMWYNQPYHAQIILGLAHLLAYLPGSYSFHGIFDSERLDRLYLWYNINRQRVVIEDLRLDLATKYLIDWLQRDFQLDHLMENLVRHYPEVKEHVFVANWIQELAPEERAKIEKILETDSDNPAIQYKLLYDKLEILSSMLHGIWADEESLREGDFRRDP